MWTPPAIERTPEQALLHERILTWDIKPGDKVAIVGGYQGIVCAYMLERYPGIDLYTWEPQLSMCDVMFERFAGVENIHIFNYALGEKSGLFPMMKAGNDACSFIIDHYNKPNLIGWMNEFTGAMASLGIDRFAVMHLNIEGYEHILVPHLIKTGWITNIDQLLISTHGLPHAVPGAETWEWTISKLNLTYSLLWVDKGFWAWTKRR